MQSEPNKEKETRRKNKQKFELIAFLSFVIMSVALLMLFVPLLHAHLNHDFNLVYLIFAVMIMLVVLYIIGVVTLGIKYGFLDKPSFFKKNREYTDLHSKIKENWNPVGGYEGKRTPIK